MISADYLDVLLTIWARAKLGDNAAFRSLSYPSATPEERYARRGAVPAGTTGYSLDVSGVDSFSRMDAAISKLRQSKHPILYSVLHARWLELGPDESRARRLGLTADQFKIKLNSARRFLRQELDETA